jgi:hypothetical protein
MGRPAIENNPEYRRVAARIDNVNRAIKFANSRAKDKVRQAKLEAERELTASLANLELEKLYIVKAALSKGLSQYAIGKVTGNTRADKQRELVKKALELKPQKMEVENG